MPPILALLLSLVTPPAQPACLTYEPSTVTIEGVIKRQTFAGPPNYESVAAGDERLDYWILHLQAPVCVEAGKYEVDAAESGVQRVQLILDARQYREYKRLIGHKVRASGTLSHQETAHHFEELLLTVARLDAADAPRE